VTGTAPSDLTAVDLLDLAPFPRAVWRDDGDRVVVEAPRPTRRGVRGLAERLAWWMGPKRVRLDARGSLLWRRLDGRTTVRELARALDQAFPDDTDQLAPRLGAWIRALRAQGLIGYRGYDPEGEGSGDGDQG
jgi:hypothetical protein